MIVDGEWSEWEALPGGCDVPCGLGKQKQRRYCNLPLPANGGKFCKGPPFGIEKINCNMPACPGNYYKI